MHKPRLLIVLNRLVIGGPAVNTLAVAHLLQDEFDVLLVAGEPAHGEESAVYLLDRYKGMNVRMIKNIKRSVLPLNDLKAFYEIKSVIKDFRPDIVHTHGSKPGVLARIAAWQLNVPVIVHTYHGHVFHSYFNSLLSALIIKSERWLAKHSSFVIAINERLKQELEYQYRIAPPSKVILNRLGIDALSFLENNEHKRIQFRNEFSIQPNQHAVGIIGRLVPVKNHKAFIELIASLLLSSEVMLKFFIVGDGDEKQKLEALLRLKKITYTHAGPLYDANASVVFTSWRKDMDDVLAGLDVVVLTSLNEGTPVSIMEAMAAGKPVIASDVGGIAELFQNGQNGVVYQQYEQLPGICLQILQNPELYASLSKNARTFASQNLTLTKQVSSLKSAYLSALNL